MKKQQYKIGVLVGALLVATACSRHHSSPPPPSDANAAALNAEFQRANKSFNAHDLTLASKIQGVGVTYSVTGSPAQPDLQVTLVMKDLQDKEIQPLTFGLPANKQSLGDWQGHKFVALQSTNEPMLKSEITGTLVVQAVCDTPNCEQIGVEVELGSGKPGEIAKSAGYILLDQICKQGDKNCTPGYALKTWVGGSKSADLAIADRAKASASKPATPAPEAGKSPAPEASTPAPAASKPQEQPAPTADAVPSNGGL
jgi:hypothetical protein